MSKKGIIKQLSGMLFLVSFLTYLASTTFFSHSHVINGEVVVHSHLHSDSHHESKTGGHSKSNITLIEFLSQLISLITVCQIFDYIVYPACNYSYINQNNLTLSFLYSNQISLRASPFI